MNKNGTPPPSFGTLPHGEFDSHYLRMFAHALPWWFHPTLEKTPYTKADLYKCMEDRLYGVMTPTEQANIGRIIKERQWLRQHLCYTIAERALYVHTEQESFDNCLAYVRHDLGRVRGHEGGLVFGQESMKMVYMPPTPGVMAIPSEHHPLWNNARSHWVKSQADVDMKIVESQKKDVQVAEWLLGNGKDAPIDRWLQNGIPEMTKLSPDCRVGRFEYVFRRRLRDAIAKSGDEFSEADRNMWVQELIDRWLEVKDDPGGQGNLRRDTTIMTRLEDLGKQHEIEDIMEADPIEIIDKLIVLAFKDKEKEKELRPLLELLIMNTAKRLEKGNDEQIAKLQFIVCTMLKLLTHHGLNQCECPSLGLATVAVRLRVNSKEDLLKLV